MRLGAQLVLAPPSLYAAIFFNHASDTKKVTSSDFVGKKGIVFIMNGWGATDHIDIWDGSDMKGGQQQYFSLGEQV